ncbi:MAG: septal ring lytic transglycosylase RlpA family protein [Syntrophobacteraceae bacterium]|nr:septal ring lytic transglycosylase RlpA family protein [Syntrophobacteraceae bacterium]
MAKRAEARSERFFFPLPASRSLLPLFSPLPATRFPLPLFFSLPASRFPLLLLLSFALAACAPHPHVFHAPAPRHGLSTQRPYRVNGIWYYPLPTASGYVEEGLASWYGPGFNGKPTACGTTYDMWAYTAAHKTLPLGTYVKVTNLANGKTVVAKITDRGPFVSGRIIDLSARCAQCLGSWTKGLARVKVEAVQGATEQVVGRATYWKPEPVKSFRYGKFAVQVGAFQNESNAYRLQDKMGGRNIRVRTGCVPGKPGLWYRVQVGAYTDIVVAKAKARKFRGDGFPGAFVIAVDER